MKKRELSILILSLILLLSFSGLSTAISDNLKTNYDQGETMITPILGNILEPITSQQVLLYRGHVQVPMDLGVKKIGETYYLWALAPLSENNYTLKINNVLTTVKGIRARVNYEKNFTVSSNLTDYSIKPGFIDSKEDFEIESTLYLDNQLSIELDFPSNSSFTLKPGKNIISFSISNITSDAIFSIDIGKYSVPVHITPRLTNQSVDTEQDIGPKIVINPRRIERTIFVSDRVSFPIILVNVGGSEASEIELNYNRTIFSLDKGPDSYIGVNGSSTFNLTLNQAFLDKVNNTSIRESFTILYNNYSSSLPIVVTLTRNYSEIPPQNASLNIYNTSDLLLCIEMRGKLCTQNEQCNGVNVSSAERGNCCKGECIAKSSGIKKSWLGFSILVVLVVIVIAVLLKYKNAGKTKNPIQKEIFKMEKN